MSRAYAHVRIALLIDYLFLSEFARWARGRIFK